MTDSNLYVKTLHRQQEIDGYVTQAQATIRRDLIHALERSRVLTVELTTTEVRCADDTADD